MSRRYSVVSFQGYVDDDSDSEESDDTDEEMEYEEPAVANFIDISKRPSSVHSPAQPIQLLTTMAPFYIKSSEGKSTNHSSMVEAIVAGNDFEAFVQVANLCGYIQDKGKGNSLGNVGFWGWLCNHDRPEMMDDFIRRTGLGITLTPEPSEHEDDKAADKKSKKREYFGLNFHGVKRKDLAKKSDPDAPQTFESTQDPVPLLWTIARNGLVETIKYLASERPIAAYKFYASSHSDAQAKLIQRIPDLAAVLPEKVGWAPNRFNETVLLAAVIGGHQDMIEALFSMRPKEMHKFAVTR